MGRFGRPLADRLRRGPSTWPQGWDPSPNLSRRSAATVAGLVSVAHQHRPTRLLRAIPRTGRCGGKGGGGPRHARRSGRRARPARHIRLAGPRPPAPLRLPEVLPREDTEISAQVRPTHRVSFSKPWTKGCALPRRHDSQATLLQSSSTRPPCSGPHQMSCFAWTCVSRRSSR